MTEFILNNPQFAATLFGALGLVVGVLFEKIKLRAPDTKTKVDDYLVMAYDFIMKNSKKESFKKIVKTIAKMIETKYVNNEIQKDDRYSELKKILHEKIATRKINPADLPENWEAVAEEAVEEFCIEDKYESLD